MERSPLRDLVVGLFVLAGLAALGYLSLSIGGITLRSHKGFEIVAFFDETGGLNTRAPVKVAGVKIGEVTAVDSVNGQARVKMTLDAEHSKLPDDTSATILTEGMLGDRYVSIEPGGSAKLLKPGDQILRTTSAVLLEKAISKFGSTLSLGPGFVKPGALHLFARFDETGGIRLRAPVVIAGVKVGEVTGTTLEKDYRVRVDMDLDPALKIDDDAMASIYTEGLIGDHYIAIQPGGGEPLKTGDEISHTQPAMIFERLIGKLVYGLTKDSSGGGKGPTTAPVP